MSNLNAILGGVAAAAPGIASGIQGMQDNSQRKAIGANAGQMASQTADAINQGGQVQAMTPDQLDAGITGQTPGGISSALADNSSHPMADAQHPFWNVVGSIAQGAGGALSGMQNGGVVKSNYGRPAIQPEFTKGPALPTGPNDTAIPQFTQSTARSTPDGYEAGGTVNSARQQAIQVGVGRDQTGIGQSPLTPSTEGQVLTMENGGPVPGYADGGFVNPGTTVQAPMTGGPAGFIQGLAEGQVLGRNLHEAFLQHEARKKAADYAGNVVGIDAQNQQSGDQAQPPSMLDRARDAVEGFFHHLHEGTLNDEHQPNGPAQPPVPPAGAGPAAPQAAPAQPAPNGQAIPSSQPAAGVAAPAGQTAAQPAPAAAPAAPAQAQGPVGWQKGTGAPSNPASQFAGGTPPQAAAPPAQQNQQVATGLAAAAAKQDPQANAGIPQQTPEESGKPHSLTADYWKESQQKLQAAVRSAAMAGEDPQKVYDSLTAMRNAHFQGQILRQLSAANTALLNGDEKSVRQALSNVNYYLPNGQGMTFKNATAADVKAGGASETGQLMYRNPMFGLYGHQGEPEYITVTPQHLQLLGASALDPRTVQETMLKTYSAQAAAQKEMVQAQGEYMTGQGRLLWGTAANKKADIDAQLEPTRQFLMKMTGVKNAAEAGYYDRKQDKAGAGLGPKVTMASLQKAQNDAMKAVDDNVQGMYSTGQETITGPNGQPIPNLTGTAGKQMHDAARIPSIFKGMSADQQSQARQMSATIAGANVGDVSPQEAAELGARIVRGAKGVHINPQTHQREKDVAFDPGRNTVHIWVGNGWRNVYIRPNVTDPNEDKGIPTGDDSAMLNESGGGSPSDDSQNMSG